MSRQLTLGDLLNELYQWPDDLPVIFPGDEPVGCPHSYRGYAADIAFEPMGDIKTIGFWRQYLQTYVLGWFFGPALATVNTKIWRSRAGFADQWKIVGTKVHDRRFILLTQMRVD